MKKVLFLIVFYVTLSFNLKGQNPLSVKLNQVQQDSIELIIKKINFESYYNGTIDSLFTANPVLGKYTDYIFFTEPSNCLDRLALKFGSDDSNLIVEIYPSRLKYLERCKKGKIWWDIEVLKKEKLRQVVIW